MITGTTHTTDLSDPFAQIAHKLAPNGRLLRAWELKGGISAQVTALEIELTDGQTQKMIVRQHGEVDRKQKPRVAVSEFKLLQILQAAGLAAPAPYYLDQSCEIFPIPYIVIEYVEGTTADVPAQQADLVRQLATHLSRIHQLDCTPLDLSFLPQQVDRYAAKIRTRPTKPDESLEEGRIRDVLEAAWPFQQRNPSRVLHGDFWPGNTLWRDGQLMAVIDWEDAEFGDPLADLGNSRLEILWSLGIEAMEQFTQYYLSCTPIDASNLPYWDLCAALRPASRIGEWAGDEATEKAMREGHRVFRTQAFERLAGR